jgi:hypothetical protein
MDGYSFSLWSTRALCAGMTTVYVGLLYAVPAKTRQLRRDDPRQIRARFVCVSVASAVCCGAARWMLRDIPGAATWEWFGVAVHGVATATLLPLVLTATLFAVPLFTMGAGEIIGRTSPHACISCRQPTQPASLQGISYVLIPHCLCAHRYQKGGGGAAR